MKASMTPEETNKILSTGRKLVVTKAQGGHKKGDKVTVLRINYGTPIYIYTEERPNSYLTPSNVELVPLTIKELEKENKALGDKKKEIDDEISFNKSKIKFMQENKLDTYDEEEFKVYKTLEALEDPATSKVQKAKIIASLIRS